MKKYLSYVIIFFVSLSIGILFTKLFFSSENEISSIEESLVYIEVEGNDFISNGSGFVYKIENNKNYIITNYHIIDECEKINVYNSKGNIIEANIYGIDKVNDIAILEIDDKLGLKEAVIGKSSKLNVGDEVYAVGTPIDYRYFGTITHGIISYLNRKITIDGSSTYNVIQVDANINGGNSGGPLVNSNGSVVGVVFIKEADIDGVGFAIPIETVLESIDKIMN